MFALTFEKKTPSKIAKESLRSKQYRKWLNPNSIDLLLLVGESKSSITRKKRNLTFLLNTTEFLAYLIKSLIAVGTVFFLALIVFRVDEYVNLKLLLAILGCCIFAAISLLNCCLHIALTQYRDIQVKIFKFLGVDYIDARIRYEDSKKIKLKIPDLDYRDRVEWTDRMTKVKVRHFNSLFDDKYAIDRLTKHFIYESDDLEKLTLHGFYNGDLLKLKENTFSEKYLALESDYNKKNIDISNNMVLVKTFLTLQLELTNYHLVGMGRYALALFICMLYTIAQVSIMTTASSEFIGVMYIAITLLLCCFASTYAINLKAPRILNQRLAERLIDASSD